MQVRNGPDTESHQSATSILPVEADFAPSRPADDAALGPLIAAARECFAAQGVDATRMEDIARRAGISRQYLYRFVSSRAELLELAVLERLEELGAELARQARLDADDVADAIVDQILIGIGLGRNDPEFVALAEYVPRARLNLLLTSGRSPLHRINSRVFGPLFARALGEGRLRTDVSADAIVEWLQGVMALFAGRSDLDDEAQRTMIRAFVLPGLIR
jgi:AcrR family transcriptional regulator